MTKFQLNKELRWTTDEVLAWISYRHYEMVKWILTQCDSSRRSTRRSTFLYPSLCPYEQFVEKKPTDEGGYSYHFRPFFEGNELEELEEALRNGRIVAFESGDHKVSCGTWVTRSVLQRTQSGYEHDRSITFARQEVLRLWPVIGARGAGRPVGTGIDDSTALAEMRALVVKGVSVLQAAKQAAEQAGGGGSLDSKVRRLKHKFAQKHASAA